jgi:hypothetical protein
MKDALVSFVRTVRVKNVEGLSLAEIKDKAIEIHNEDPTFATEEDVLSITEEEK